MITVVSVEQRIQTIFKDRLQIEVPASMEDLFQRGILDSLLFVDLLVALEEEFSIQIALDQVELNDFRTISKICEYVNTALEGIVKVPLGRHSAV